MRSENVMVKYNGNHHNPGLTHTEYRRKVAESTWGIKWRNTIANTIQVHYKDEID